MKSQKRHAAIRGTFPQKLSYVHGSYRVKRTGNGKAIFVYRKLLRRVTNLVLECRRILSLSDVQDLKSTLWEIMKLRICQLRNIIIIHSQNFHTKVLVWVIPHLKLQPEKAKNIEETENTYSDEGLNVSNDIFVEGPEYLEVNI
ncbi:hypothetical protein RIR_jg28628.t1 [Rhizophagus irregularis DAOM 181602=DAOM 197198]|nr:hypothetical protein RIR_jg28628.t1 [Rhizophagus irregularis DAOM 181602=DAOM 197198]